MILNIFVVIFVSVGLLFFTGAAIGIIRFPDFYSRLHPAGKMDTLALLVMLSGLALFNLHEFTLSNALTSLKIMFIVVFVFMAGPTATHAIVDAGFRAGLPHYKKNRVRT